MNGTYSRELDAYGHLTYTVGWSDEWNEDVPEDSDRGDWMACFDFTVSECGQWLAYQVVVNSDSGGFIETVDEGEVPIAEAAKLADLPDYWLSVGDNEELTEAEARDSARCIELWRRDILAACSKKD